MIVFVSRKYRFVILLLTSRNEKRRGGGGEGKRGIGHCYKIPFDLIESCFCCCRFRAVFHCHRLIEQRFALGYWAASLSVCGVFFVVFLVDHAQSYVTNDGVADASDGIHVIDVGVLAGRVRLNRLK